MYKVTAPKGRQDKTIRRYNQDSSPLIGALRLNATAEDHPTNEEVRQLAGRFVVVHSRWDTCDGPPRNDDRDLQISALTFPMEEEL
jgi:hypothetical protein